MPSNIQQVTMAGIDYYIKIVCDYYTKHKQLAAGSFENYINFGGWLSLSVCVTDITI